MKDFKILFKSILQNKLSIILLVLSFFATPKIVLTEDAIINPSSVKLLIASWCVRCKDMEDLLKEQNVSYQRLDVENDPSAKDLYDKVGGGGVPILIVGNKLLKGYNHSAVIEILKSRDSSFSDLKNP